MMSSLSTSIGNISYFGKSHKTYSASSGRSNESVPNDWKSAAGRRRQNSSTGTQTLVRQKKSNSMQCHRNHVLTLFAVIFSFVLITIVALVRHQSSSPQESTHDYCNNKELDEYQVLTCEMQTKNVCHFDTSKCPLGCMLGYEQNALGCSVSCDCATKGHFESDILFNPITIQTILSNYIMEEDSSYFTALEGHSYQQYWNVHEVAGRYRVPFVFANGTGGSHMKLIFEAITQLSHKTCIDFYVRTNEIDFVEFSSAEHGCKSFIGRVGGRQLVNIGNGCSSGGLVLHQLLHTLGLWHEQSRSNRDDHVTIKFQNVARDHHFHFRKRSVKLALNAPYDKLSILHSSGYFYSKNGEPTINDRNTSVPIQNQRRIITRNDVKKINAFYPLCTRNTDATAGITPTAGGNSNTSGFMWSVWSTWQLCSACCGYGQRARVRECMQKATAIVPFQNCIGLYYEMEPCTGPPCIGNIFSEWSSCSTTCGIGLRHRSTCSGNQLQEEVCSVIACPRTISSQWGAWQTWGKCSRSCGNGFSKRSRTCVDTIMNQVSVAECPSSVPGRYQYKRCASNSCKAAALTALDANIKWKPWDDWSSCFKQGSSAVQLRTRECVDCSIGPTTESRKCGREVIAEGRWSEWTSWSNCSVSCGNTRERSRSCVYANIQVIRNCPGGSDENGQGHEVEACPNTTCSNLTAVKLDSHPKFQPWGVWGEWSSCSETCKGARQYRSRSCSGLQLATKCLGPPFELRLCKEELLECRTEEEIWNSIVNADKYNKTKDGLLSIWGDWQSWGRCSVTCGTGVRMRNRTCVTSSCLDSPIEFGSCSFYKTNVSDSCNNAPTAVFWNECMPKVCEKKEHYKVGHFNNDSYIDIACVGRRQIRVFASPNNATWSGNHSLCAGIFIKNILVGDINGDGIDDLVCPWHGHLTVLYGGFNAAFHGPYVTYKDVCNAQAVVRLGHMDRDFKIDVICGSLPALSLPEKIIYNQMITET